MGNIAGVVIENAVVENATTTTTTSVHPIDT